MEEIIEDKWMNAIVKIIHFAMTGCDGKGPAEEAIEDFIEKVRQGELNKAFLSLPLVIWSMCEDNKLQEKYSELFAEAIIDSEDADEIIGLANNAVNSVIFSGEFDESQAEAEYFLQCLTDMSLESLKKENTEAIEKEGE